MPAVARADRRGAHRRPFVLATIATTAIGAPTLISVPAVAAEVPLTQSATPIAALVQRMPATATATLPALTAAVPTRTAPSGAMSMTPLRQSPLESRYTVRRGDTLIHIARDHGTTVRAIQAANSINGSRIYAGQVITIPGSGTSTSSPATSAPASSGSSHRVVAGDTLGHIALRHGTSVRAIQQANGLSGTVIRVGQTLTIPGAAGSPGTSAPSNPTTSTPSTPPSGGTYTVRAGDSLSVIAARNGTTVAALVSANSLTSANRIYVGQRLTLPGGSSGAGAAAPTGPVTSDPGNTSGGVGSTFLGRTYAPAVVGAANANRTVLVNTGVPSRAEMESLVRSTAISMGVDPRLALAHAFVESGFNHASVSPANAIGTMQVIPSSGDWASQLVGRPLNIMNPQDNVVAGVAIIRSLQNSADSFDQGVAGYYQGLAGVRRNGMYPDTVRYVATIRTTMDRF